MKEYRLASWPELPSHLQRTGHRRILSDMSHRHLTIAQLVECSGLKRQDVILFIERLETGGHVTSHELAVDEAPARSKRPFEGWLRRALAYAQDGR
jgi:hypothetical protein